jgi:hypothetical protein
LWGYKLALWPWNQERRDDELGSAAQRIGKA